MRVPFTSLFAEHPNQTFSPIASPVRVGGVTIFSGRMLPRDYVILGKRIVDIKACDLEVDVEPGDVHVIKKVY